MAAAMNGMALHGGVIPYGGTFLIFSDYCRPAIRLSALQKARVIYVMTHDSIGLGEDGPTHQPIEQLQSLRAMPQLEVYRPADAVETAECWAAALDNDGPTVLALTRQNLTPVRTRCVGEESVRAGRLSAARRRRAAQGDPDRHRLRGRDRAARLPNGSKSRGSAPTSSRCRATERFDEQDAEYREDILPDVSNSKILRVSIEAGATFGWERYTGLHGLRIGIDRFGASAPGDRPVSNFGLTPDAIVPQDPGELLKKRKIWRRGWQSTASAASGGWSRGRSSSGRDCGLELVTINDLADAKSNAWLFRATASTANIPGTVAADGNDLVVDGKHIHVTAERDPGQAAAQGQRDRAGARMHRLLRRPRRRAEAHRRRRQAGADLGAGERGRYDGRLRRQPRYATRRAHDRLERLVHDQLPGAGRQGAERHDRHRARVDDHVHAYTNDQRILDQIHPDLRRARAAAMSMIPTTTGAARAVGEVLPELKGKLDGSSIRVPMPDGSLIDLTFTPGRDTSRDEVNAILKAAAESGPLKGMLDYIDEPLVSIDLDHKPQSATVDSLETAVLEGKLARVVSWYDNEWGFSNRMVDTAGGDGRADLSAGDGRFNDPRRPAADCAASSCWCGSTSTCRCRTARSATTRRLRASAPTIAELADRGANVLLLAHFGRPKGRARPDMRLALLVRPLSDAARARRCVFIEDCRGRRRQQAVAHHAARRRSRLLENTRFHAGEETNDPALAKAIAALGDFYVNDAFSAAHRAHA